MTRRGRKLGETRRGSRGAHTVDAERKNARFSTEKAVWEEGPDGWHRVAVRVPDDAGATHVSRVPFVPAVPVADALRGLCDIAELAQVAEIALRARLRDAEGWSILMLVGSLLSARRKKGMRDA